MTPSPSSPAIATKSGHSKAFLPSGSVLETALCYLDVIHSKVPELIEREKNGTAVPGEIDCMCRVAQGDLEAEEWCELPFGSVMANFIRLDAAIDLDVRDPDTMTATKVLEYDEVLPPLLRSAPTLSVNSFLSGLKSHIAQIILAKKYKTPSVPLPPMPPLTASLPTPYLPGITHFGI
ncbi:hypothetical protein FIBSPDRAFT_41257 [Athelia psychrophila]|uniref:Uncharacterized protein n=1 Tax=Athelia psychrophila TaxID=1759441 RepID=A0A166FLX6_9AGAM|nr:hypothetical protein FIBSPDRAFT_41201 [Fibularhizoctonia sp. CBS 109695]KZP16950.1 hypothetical protein FIBSPDRAFT_41257 [Fibularhizoctonia sp. CBS 109695]